MSELEDVFPLFPPSIQSLPGEAYFIMHYYIYFIILFKCVLRYSSRMVVHAANIVKVGGGKKKRNRLNNPFPPREGCGAGEPPTAEAKPSCP